MAFFEKQIKAGAEFDFDKRGRFLSILESTGDFMIKLGENGPWEKAEKGISFGPYDFDKVRFGNPSGVDVDAAFSVSNYPIADQRMNVVGGGVQVANADGGSLKIVNADGDSLAVNQSTVSVGEQALLDKSDFNLSDFTAYESRGANVVFVSSVENTNGFFIRYAHCSAISPSSGSNITSLDVDGVEIMSTNGSASGNSGNMTVENVVVPAGVQIVGRSDSANGPVVMYGAKL